MAIKIDTLKQRNTSLDLVLYPILFLFFFQLLTEFIEATYVFGLLGTSLPVEAVSVMVLFSPFLLTVSRRGISPSLLLVLGELMIICRAFEVMLDTRGRMLISGIGVGAFLLFLPAFLACLRREQEGQESFRLSLGVSLAVLLAIILRVLNSGSDLSLSGDFRMIGWVLALLAGVFLVVRLEPANLSNTTAVRQGDQSGKNNRLLAFSLGIIGIFTLLYFAFISPNVITCWSEGNYPSIVALLAGSWSLLILTLCFKPDLLLSVTPLGLVAGNLFFLLGTSLTILMHQVRFPASMAAYPLAAPQTGILAYFPLVIMLILSPILGVDFFFFIRGLLRERPTSRTLGWTFGVASFMLLLLIFAHIFTTVYDYIPVIGPLFRNRFWLVYLAANVLILLPLLSLPRLLEHLPVSIRSCQSLPMMMLVGVLWLAAVVGVFILPNKPFARPESGLLRVLTYNVQQGYSEDGQRNFDGQISLIRSADPDVIGLQECDTNRIANGNADLVRYFADRLGMYSYYGPKTVTGTFGIALLSKYPIENLRTFFMYSQGEQTAAIEADIHVDGKTFHLLVTHLGNGGPIVQQQAVLQELAEEENIIAMGDFNFRPDSEQYRLTTESLADAWLLAEQKGLEPAEFNPEKRIDHVFVSPGTKILRSWYILSPQSDHPALVVEIGW
mgnify:CR=1 FL=1